MVRSVPVAAVAAALLLSGATSVHAVSSACSGFSPDVTGFVTGTSACEIDPAIANDAPVAPFLAAEFFGFDDWMFDSKSEADPDGLDMVNEGTNSLGLSITAKDSGAALELEGNWSLDAGAIAGKDVMLVFKGGNPLVPNALVAYLVSASSGMYQSMFFQNTDPVDLTSPTEISHISVWYRDNGTSVVPLPAAGWLLLTGIGALGVFARRARG